MSKRVLYDLCCNAGGATKGYQRAGFYVVGVDINPQPNYCGDRFVQADALDFPLTWADAVHASPPCQGYSAMSTCRPGLAATYPKLIEPLRDQLIESGLPYVIENVEGAPLINPTVLCGTMFGRDLYRHRLFETNFPLPLIAHPEHTVPASKAGHWRPGTIMSVAGHVAPIAHARQIMDMDWTTREELAEAIPPFYTEWIGAALMAHLAEKDVAA